MRPWGKCTLGQVHLGASARMRLTFARWRAQAITFDAFTISMYGLVSVLSTPAVFLFYFIIVFAGGLFIVNLFLVRAPTARAVCVCRVPCGFTPLTRR